MLAVLRLWTIRMIDPPDTKTTTLRYHPMRAWKIDYRSEQAESLTLGVKLEGGITEIVSVVEQTLQSQESEAAACKDSRLSFQIPAAL